MEVDKPIDFGLQDYCSKCGICAQNCPVHAIPEGDKVEHNGYVDWVHDRKKCVLYCVNHPHGDICQRCTKVCPFNRPDVGPADFKDWDGDLSKLYEQVEARRVQMENYNYQEPEEQTGKWWFPLSKQDGVLKETGEYIYRTQDK